LKENLAKAEILQYTWVRKEEKDKIGKQNKASETRDEGCKAISAGAL